MKINYSQPIAPYRPTTVGKVNSYLPLPQISIPKRLTHFGKSTTRSDRS
ncbi:hypothetical protein IQ244_30975 [Nostoc sp. LEGE 06077]|nr:hypothetical protein [Nostoc sp. LEGE 06077]